jgi:ABC-type protease/lipase transport system fused ATPase/permease subunit
MLDEPNANLDVSGEAALIAALADLKARGVTVIMVSHDLTLMSALDKLALLKDGALELFGPSTAVLARLRGTAPPSRVLTFPAAKGTEALA